MAKKPAEPSADTLNVEAYLLQLRARRAYYLSVEPFYLHPKHRKMRRSARIQLKRAESMMVRKLEVDRRITDWSKVVVLCGDYSMWGRSMGWNACSRGKAHLDFFRRLGARVFYIYEARTSMMCSNCQDRGAEMRKFLRVKDPMVKRWKRTADTPTRLCHGLVQCSRCHVRFDRDWNAAINIRYLALAIIYEWHNPPNATPGAQFRPLYLQKAARGAAAAAAAAPAPAAGAPGDDDDDDDDDDEPDDE